MVYMNPPNSTILEETLEFMGYSSEASADILQQLSPSVREYLSFFNRLEIQGILEAMLFVYIAQNSHTTNGKGEGAYERCCPEGTLALKQCGLVREASWNGVRVVLPSQEGTKVAHAMVRGRMDALQWDALAQRVHPLVPFFFAGSSHYRYTEKTLPIGNGENGASFLGFITHCNPVVFSEVERFARLLAESGLAVVAWGYPKGSFEADRCQYVFPNEMVYILHAITETYSDALTRECLAFVEYVRRKFLILEFLKHKQHFDAIQESRELQADLITYLDKLADSIEVVKIPSHRGDDAGVQFIVSDEERYQKHLSELAASLQREIAFRFGGSPDAGAASALWRREGVQDLGDSVGRRENPGISNAIPPHAGDERTGAIQNCSIPRAPLSGGETEGVSAPHCTDRSTLESLEEGVRFSSFGQDSAAPKSWSTASGMHTLNSEGGRLAIFLGYSGNGDTVFWAPGTLNNGHFIIIGGSGAGKTETIRCIAAELDREGYPVLLIDFHGDMTIDTERFRSYRIREGSSYYFNPLELDPAFEEITPLRATSDFVDAISINFPTLGIQQRRSIKGIIKDSYRKAGITADKETWFKKLNFDEIEDAIMTCEDEAIPAYLEDIFDYKLFAGTEKIAVKGILSGGVTHMNLNALPENLRYLFADLFLRRLFYSLQALGEIPRDTDDTREKFRLFIIVDEAKLLVSQKSGQKQVIKAVLNKYATEMRKFGVSLILASQLISHFNDEILANIAVKLCMRTENKKQAQENSKFFEVSESDLMNFQPGEGILIIGSEKMNVKIVPIKERRGSNGDGGR